MGVIQAQWVHFWMRFAGRGHAGRIATRLATWFAPPYKARHELARLYPRGYISPTAVIYHDQLRLGEYIFIGDRVVIFGSERSGPVELGDHVDVHQDVIIESGADGSLTVGSGSRLQAGCQLMAYRAPITIGRDVGIAQYCALYPYDHGFEPGKAISRQPLRTKGGIVIEDHAWLGAGVVVLSGVRIGRGAVIGAGAVVTRDVPDDAIAVGVPARIVGKRGGKVGRGSEISDPLNCDMLGASSDPQCLGRSPRDNQSH
jgi:acetyltransferase-like isoleucine patch superfamily enzyme